MQVIVTTANFVPSTFSYSFSFLSFFFSFPLLRIIILLLLLLAVIVSIAEMKLWPVLTIMAMSLEDRDYAMCIPFVQSSVKKIYKHYHTLTNICVLISGKQLNNKIHVAF